MAQPPDRPIMGRALTRAVPFVTPRTFKGILGPGGVIAAQFDTLEGFAEPSFFNNVGAFPGAALGLADTGEVTKAVGPLLDCLVYATGAASLSVYYAVDRACAYHLIIPAIAIPPLTPSNISGLRITGRFVAVILTDTSLAPLPGGNPVEFGVYVRSQ